MVQVRAWATVVAAVALGASVAGAGDAVELRLRVLDEIAPAGSVVQMKIRTYEVTPISASFSQFDIDNGIFAGVESIGMFARAGEVAGVAAIDGTHVVVAYVTTDPLTTDTYPFLTVSLRIRDDAAIGSRAQFTLDPSSLWNVGGNILASAVTPGTVFVGGSVAVTDVVPGEGSFPAGTVVSVRGTGFNSRSRLRVEDLDVGSVRVMSANEIRFTLRAAANMTGQRLRVDNPDGSRSTYYSFTRGIPAATSARTLLSSTQPIFSGTTRYRSTFGPMPVLNGSQYAGLALQNPNLAAAAVTVGVYAADGTFLNSSSRVLDKGTRLTLELSELLSGVPPPTGSYLVVSSSLRIQAFGVLCDEAAWRVVPRLSIEAVTAGGAGTGASS